MAIDIDPRYPLRRPGELMGLVRAILNANPNDESNWLEWKGSLDLSSAAGRFHVAKGVLGMANRMPEVAASTCGGVGYVVVGAEPENLAGVLEVDPAQLDDGLSPYLGGAKGPIWGATYVDLDRSLVLVVTVEPPKRGDPIFLLRKEFGSYRDGTPFVRKNGKTAPADANDMDLLQARLRAPSVDPLELEMTAVGDLPLSWFDPSTIDSAIDAWVASRHAALVADAEHTERVRSEERKIDLDDPMVAAQRLAASWRQLASIPNPLVKPDDRTLQDYVTEVENWSQRLRESAKDAWPGRYLDGGHGVIRLQATNPTDRNLMDVLVKATFPGEDVIGLDEYPDSPRLPRPPRKYGKPVRLDAESFIRPLNIPNLGIDPIIPQLRSTWVEEGSVRIGWSVGDLRPRESDESEDVYIFLRSRPDDRILRGTWEATSKSTDGVLKGQLIVPVSEESVDLATLLEVSDEAGSR